MKALRLEVMRDLLDIKGMSADMLRAVLSHPNIAIVDREAKLPESELKQAKMVDESRKIYGLDNFHCTAQYLSNFLEGYNRCQADMRDAGWVKEIKDKGE